MIIVSAFCILYLNVTNFSPLASIDALRTLQGRQDFDTLDDEDVDRLMEDISPLLLIAQDNRSPGARTESRLLWGTSPLGLHSIGKMMEHTKDSKGRMGRKFNSSVSHNELRINKRVQGGERQFFTYVISPWSRQILPFRSDRLAQGYRNFFTLANANQNYKIGLQKQTSSEEDGLRSMMPDEANSKSVSDCQAVRVNVDLIREDKITIEPVKMLDSELSISELSQMEPSVVRQISRICRGSVELNRCDGACRSSTQPSVKSRNGFKKDCYCCSEGSFRRIDVRLDDCFLPSENNKKITPEDNEGKWMSFMDIEVEEPVECQCRRCESSS